MTQERGLYTKTYVVLATYLPPVRVVVSCGVILIVTTLMTTVDPTLIVATCITSAKAKKDSKESA